MMDEMVSGLLLMGQGRLKLIVRKGYSSVMDFTLRTSFS